MIKNNAIYSHNSKTSFFRKAIDIDELKQLTKKYPNSARKFFITRYIELDCEEYDKFSKSLLADWKFIQDNKEGTCLKDDVYWCLLIYCKERDFGILVDCEGYDYARYTALLDLNNFLKETGNEIK